jgi:hypothetical protein
MPLLATLLQNKVSTAFLCMVSQIGKMLNSQRILLPATALLFLKCYFILLAGVRLRCQ